MVIIIKKKNLVFILSLFFLASCSTGGSITKPSVSNNSTNNSPSTSNSTSISKPSTSASISSPTTTPDEGFEEFTININGGTNEINSYDDDTFIFSGGLLFGYGTSDMVQKPTA